MAGLERTSGLTRARVALDALGLPARWRDARGRAFTLLEIGFGGGAGVLASWDAWCRTPPEGRAARLIHVVVDAQATTRAALAAALAPRTDDAAIAALAATLIDRWPPASADLQVLDLAAPGGRPGDDLRLLLAWGPPERWLRALALEADAVRIEPALADRLPAQAWRLLGQRCRPGAPLVADDAPHAMQQGLLRAGFQIEAPPPGLRARHGSWPRRRPPGRAPQEFGRAPPRAIVVGAGLAGAAAGAALADRGVAVTLLEAAAQPALGGSSQRGGLFHPTLHPDDGVHARWLRAGARWMAEDLRRPSSHPLPGGTTGLLRGERALEPAAMQALAAELGWPTERLAIRPWPCDDAAGPRAAWAFAEAGWTEPAAWIGARLNGNARIDLRAGAEVSTLRRSCEGTWLAIGTDGAVLAEAPAVVLAAAQGSVALREALAGQVGAGLGRWPELGVARGQTTRLDAATWARVLARVPSLAREPLASGGYALTLADGSGLVGATSQSGDTGLDERAADHAANLDRLRALLGPATLAGIDLEAGVIEGRTGLRLRTRDRLPLVGPWPAAVGGRQPTQAPQVPRVPGLWVLTALGSRGLSQAGLAGDLLAAWMLGEPLPVPDDLVDAVDVARQVARDGRHSA